MPQVLTAQEIYDKLINDECLVGKIGHITFSLSNLGVRINKKDTVGNLLQEWLEAWMVSEDVVYAENPNRQTFPDFFLNPLDDKNGLLEVKTFDKDRGPGFDIANFDAYCNSLLTNAYRLDSDYLIFAYSMTESGDITIENIWLKKIWDIAGASGTYPLKVQEKKQIIYNIRPVIWFSQQSTYKAFGTKEGFLKALNETRYQYNVTKPQNNHWLQKVLKNYKLHTGVDLEIER